MVEHVTLRESAKFYVEVHGPPTVGTKRTKEYAIANH